MTSVAGSRVGQQAGNYRLQHLIGQGGFADIYLGEHVYLKTQAAVKVLHTQLAQDDQENFLNEARTIARLKHPHILPVLEYGVEAGIPFLVMDYAPNGSLRGRYRKGSPLNPIIVLPHIKQIAAALQYAHQENIIHRDIKPENILLGAHNEVLLSDFGMALGTQSSRTQSTEDIAGTVTYMAPESLQGRPCPASDQYSLAIVLYEWLSGDCPFHGSFSEIASQQVLVPPPPIKAPAISPEVEAVILRALAKDPQQRYESLQTFADAFEQASMDVGETFRAGISWRQPHIQTQPAIENQTSVRKNPSFATPTAPAAPLATQVIPSHKTPRRKPSRGMAIVLIALALLTTTSGLAAALYTIGLNTGWLGPTLQERVTTQAQATTTAFQDRYRQATSGKPVLDDSLSANESRWETGIQQDMSCLFKDRAYHITTTFDYPTWCTTMIANDFSNIAYQVQMTIVQGNEGGMTFRLTYADKQPVGSYFFSVNQNGTYTLLAWKYKPPYLAKTLLRGSSRAIKSGLHQPNQLTVVVQGNQIILYINQHYIGSVADDTFKTGYAGLFAAKTPDDTEVAFSNVKIWRL